MELRNEISIEAPAERVWQALGEGFMRMGEWASPIASSCPLDAADPRVGATRRCSHAAVCPFKPGVVLERLTSFDRSRMSFEDEAVDGMPAFVVRAANRWTVDRLSEHRSIVRVRATVTLRGPARLLSCPMKWQLQAVGVRVLLELKYFVEHDRPHPRKQALLGSPPA